MIIELIVLLGFLGSLIGFIFFVRHYFKSWKARSNDKKLLLAIESAEDSNACYDRFYHNILSDIDWSRIVIFTFFVGGSIMLFFIFASPNKDVSTGNTGVQIPTPTINNSNQNDTITEAVTTLQSTGIPLWVFFVAGGIIFWLMTRRIWRNLSYGGL